MSENYPEEFLGGKIKVLQARNKSLEGIEGRIIDETKHTFRVKTAKREEKTLLKQGAVFVIANKKLRGSELLRRPEERIKPRK